MTEKQKKLLLVGGIAAGVGIYFWRRRTASTAVVPSAVPVPAPAAPGLLSSLFENIFGAGLKTATAPAPTAATPATVLTFEGLQKKVRARGDSHYLAWSGAFRLDQPVYWHGGKCYSTQTAEALPVCPDPKMLAGY